MGIHCLICQKGTEKNPLETYAVCHGCYVALKDQLHRRNALIKKLRKRKDVFSKEELHQIDNWWNGLYSGSKSLHDKILRLLNR